MNLRNPHRKPKTTNSGCCCVNSLSNDLIQQSCLRLYTYIPMHTNTPVPASIAKLRHQEKRRPVFITDTITKHNIGDVLQNSLGTVIHQEECLHVIWLLECMSLWESVSTPSLPHSHQPWSLPPQSITKWKWKLGVCWSKCNLALQHTQTAEKAVHSRRKRHHCKTCTAADF